MARTESIFSSLRTLLCAFIDFSGAKGLKAFFFVFLGAAVEGVGLLLLVPFFSLVIDAQHTGSWGMGMAARFFALFSAENRFARLTLLVALFAVLMVARAVIITVRDVTMAQLEIGFLQRIRSRITGRLAAAPWNTVSRLRHSRMTYLMGSDIQHLNIATSLLLRDAVAVVMLLSQIVLAFLLAPRLAGLALLVVLLGTATLVPMVRRARAVGTFATNANLSLLDDMTKFLGCLKLAISQNLQERFTKEFDATLGELKAHQIRYVRQQTITRLAITTLSAVVGAVAILLGLAVFDISSSVLITLLVIFSRISGPALQLQLGVQQIALALPAYEKIRELESELAAAETPIAVSPASSKDFRNQPIIFRTVTFLHDAAIASGLAGGVREIDLIIQPGSIVGITGPSGAGKTTFADLLVGLYPPQSGEILIGGVAVRGSSAAAWRNSVGYVAQDPFLFHDTLRRNLLWANPGADEFALRDVLRVTAAEEIVGNMPQGLDTVVGERGGLLSGGARQRLCLARAMLRHPSLLVLDEATSAIDIEGECALFERLLLVIPRPTIVIIAHRLESLRYCQRVLILDRGKLVSDYRQSIPAARLSPHDRRARRRPRSERVIAS